MPRVVKHRPWGGIGWERIARTIMHMRARGASEAQIDQEQASLEWSSAFGRLWRYIGQHEHAAHLASILAAVPK